MHVLEHSTEVEISIKYFKRTPEYNLTLGHQVHTFLTVHRTNGQNTRCMQTEWARLAQGTDKPYKRDVKQDSCSVMDSLWMGTLGLFPSENWEAT